MNSQAEDREWQEVLDRVWELAYAGTDYDLTFAIVESDFTGGYLGRPSFHETLVAQMHNRWVQGTLDAAADVLDGEPVYRDPTAFELLWSTRPEKVPMIV